MIKMVDKLNLFYEVYYRAFLCVLQLVSIYKKGDNGDE